MAPATFVGMAVNMASTAMVAVIMVIMANNYFIIDDSMSFDSRASSLSILVSYLIPWRSMCFKHP